MNRRQWWIWLVGLMMVAHHGWADQSEEDDMRDARQQMVREIERDVTATAVYIGRGHLNQEIMRVMGEVPRHEFVPRGEREASYVNAPLPIGFGQTISQPYIVALMTDLLAVSREAKVLEVGAGSGYQAAVLSHLVKEVHSIEIIPQLAKACRERITRLGYTNITVHEGDGY